MTNEESRILINEKLDNYSIQRSNNLLSSICFIEGFLITTDRLLTIAKADLFTAICIPAVCITGAIIQLKSFTRKEIIVSYLTSMKKKLEENPSFTIEGTANEYNKDFVSKVKEYHRQHKKRI